MTHDPLFPVPGLPAHVRVTASTLATIAAQPDELREDIALIHWAIANDKHVLVGQGPCGPTATICIMLSNVDPAAVDLLREDGTLHPTGAGLMSGIAQVFGPPCPAIAVEPTPEAEGAV